MERSYTILLDRGGRYPTRRRRARSAFEQTSDFNPRVAADLPQPAIHRERLTAPELEELAQEPEFVAAAEVMRTRLLAPVAEAVEERGGAMATASGGRCRSWGISAVGADRSKFTGSDVTVAVLDTGIDAEHSAFRGVDLVEKDFTGLGNGDRDGHGTHCAGVLFGRNVHGVRIGVAPGVRRALIGKILGPDGGNSDMLARGVAWAHEEGANVISMSVGFDFAATVADRLEQGWIGELATAVTLEAYRANLCLLGRLLEMLRTQEPFTGGAIMVAAAGNDSSRGIEGEFVMSARPPSGSDNIVSVGSLDPDAAGRGYRISAFSNGGVELTAPGRAVISAALGGGLKALSGTSVAAPHVAGAAALWWQAVRQAGLPANATLVRDRLVGSAQTKGFSPAVFPSERGAGLVFAPTDGLSVVPEKPAERLRRRDLAPTEGIPWARGEGRASSRAGFEPIALDLTRAQARLPGGRRNLC